jgi:hypothetical protein
MAAAKVEIIYEAEATSLKAVVNEVNKVNSDVVESAKQTSTKFANEFKNASKEAANAFANGQLTGAIKNLNTQVASLTTGLKLNTDAFKKFDTEAQKTNKILIQSAQDVAKYEDRLRELSVAGQRATQEFEDIAKAVGEYKSAIIAADRAVDLYAKSTDAATGRIGELEDKLYDLALAGKSNTREFKDIVREVANVRRAVIETDAQVDALAQRGARFKGFVQNVELVGSAFQAVEGAQALIGQENEDLQKTLVRLQAITAITSGIEQARVLILEQLAAKTGVAGAAQSAYNVIVGTSTGLLKGLRIALAATGIGLFVFGLIALVENFEKVKKALENSIPGFKTVSNAIGDVVDKIKEWVGASGDAERAGAAFDAAAKKQNAATKAIVDGYERRIAVEQAAGRNTTALEIEREEAIIAANKKILKDYQLASTEIIKLNQEQKQAAIETAQAAKDAVDESENNIKVIRATAAKEAADKAKENAEAIAKAQKETFTNLLNETAQLQKDFDKKQAEERKASEAKLQVELADLADTSLQTQLDTRLAFLRRLEIEEGTSLDRRINIIELEAQKRQDNIRNTVADTALANQLILEDEAKTQAAIRDERKKSADEAIDQTIEIANATAQLFSDIVEIQANQSEKRVEQIEQQATTEEESIKNSELSAADKERKLEALRIRTEQKIAAEKRKQALNERAAAIFQATIATAVAIAKALPNPVTAAIAAAAGAAQVLIITSQPIPKFKKGGMVKGKSHEAGGAIIEAEGGEFVMNKNATSQHRKALDAMNTSSAAFKKYIEDRYLRPAIIDYAMKSKDKAVVVKASLNSKSMERKLDKLNKTMRNNNIVVNIGNEGRYQWHNR